MGSVISAIGTATPAFSIPQGEILNFMTGAHSLGDRDAVRLRKLYEVSGIKFRHSVIPDFGLPPSEYTFFGKNSDLTPFPSTLDRARLYEEQAWQIGRNAVEDLIRQAATFDIAGVTHLITVSCTGMYAPGLDIDMVEKLGLSYSTERTCINFMGCYGAFNALKTADYICRACPDAKVLIVDVELCTLHFQKENTLDNWIANSIFSDGAAAVLVESEHDRSLKSGFKLGSFYSVLVAEEKEEMGWRIGNTGFEMLLSSNIAKKIKGKINIVTAELLKKAAVPFAEISHFAIHPGGRRILEVCEEVLGLEEEALFCSYETLQRFGNMSSATILFVLKRMRERIKVGEKVAGFAFGPGLTFESMILEAF